MRKNSLVIMMVVGLALGVGACGSNVKENAVETKPLEQYEVQKDFIEKYCYDLNDNGILDAVERGEITQEYATEMGYPEETEEEKAARAKRHAEEEAFRAELRRSFGYVTEKNEEEAIREMIERNLED